MALLRPDIVAGVGLGVTNRNPRLYGPILPHSFSHAPGYHHWSPGLSVHNEQTLGFHAAERDGLARPAAWASGRNRAFASIGKQMVTNLPHPVTGLSAWEHARNTPTSVRPLPRTREASLSEVI